MGRVGEVENPLATAGDQDAERLGGDVVAAFARRGTGIAGGQDRAEPYLIRPSTMGWTDDHDVLGLAGTLEAALREAGHEVPYGAASAAAARVLEAG